MQFKSSLISFIRSHSLFWQFARTLRRWLTPILLHPITGWFRYLRFFGEMRRYNGAGGNAKLANIFPCLSDRTSETTVDPQYFYQAYWSIEKIHRQGPDHHVDVGSDVKFIGMLSALHKVTFVDIRPLRVQLPQLDCQSGTILALPYKSDSLLSVSSMHVIEHIGLGRYGDPLDPLGSDKACAELMRVVAPGGRLYVTVPVGSARIQFNGQRVFSIEEILVFFPDMLLESFSLVDNFGLFHKDIQPQSVSFDEVRGQDFALGCFEFIKRG